MLPVSSHLPILPHAAQVMSAVSAHPLGLERGLAQLHTLGEGFDFHVSMFEALPFLCCACAAVAIPAIAMSALYAVRLWHRNPTELPPPVQERLLAEGPAPAVDEASVVEAQRVELLKEAFQIVERLWVEIIGRVEWNQLRVLKGILPLLTAPDRLKIALRIEERLGDEDPSVRRATMSVLERILPDLAAPDRLERALRIGGRSRDEDADVRVGAVFELRNIIKDNYLSPSGQLECALRIEERWLVDERGHVQSQAKYAIEEIIPRVSPSVRLEWALRIGERLEEGDHHVQRNAAWELELIISHLSPPERMRLLGRSIERGGLNHLSTTLMELALRQISPETLRSYAESHGNSDLLVLARYYEARLPWEAHFWSRYYNATNREAYLTETWSHLEAYRRGREIEGFFNEEDIRLAYGGLDNPEGLSYNTFKYIFVRALLDIDRGLPLPPLFLNRPFKAEVLETRPAHRLIDRGKVNEALEPINHVRGLREFQAYLGELIRRENGHLRRIRRDLQEVFPEGLANLTLEQVLNGARELLPRIWEHRRIRPVQDLMTRLFLLLGYHRSGIEGLRAGMSGAHGRRVSSEVLMKGLQATEEFYRDTLNDVANELGLSIDEIPFIRKQRRLLQAELERARGEEGTPISVEFIPSKSQADRFSGYVGEDCTNYRFDVIGRPDFEVYRMVTEQGLMGMLYLQEATLDGRRVLVMAIEPRTRWTVENRSLFRAIEENFARIGEEEGYDYVLLSGDSGQRSNRQGMLQAITDRGYPTVHFFDSISGAIFRGNDFLVMWGR